VSKATKIDANTWHYRGFTICRNYTSSHGTRRVCSSQQGYRTTPQTHSSGGIAGDWTSTLTKAVERIDGLYRRYAAGELQYTTRAAVEEASRIARERGESTPADPDAVENVTITVSLNQARTILAALSDRHDVVQGRFNEEARLGLLTAAARTEALVDEVKAVYQIVDRQVFQGAVVKS
jgi:hypothetical protein